MYRPVSKKRNQYHIDYYPSTKSERNHLVFGLTRKINEISQTIQEIKRYDLNCALETLRLLFPAFSSYIDEIDRRVYCNWKKREEIIVLGNDINRSSTETR